VREHSALAAAGRATGVEDGSQIVGLLDRCLVLIAVMGCALEQTARAVIAQGVASPAGLRGASLSKNFPGSAEAVLPR